MRARSASHAADKPGSADHAIVSRLPGSSIKDYAVSKFDEIHFPIKPFTSDDRKEPPADKLVAVEGKITYISYIVPVGISMLEVSRSYEQALTANGFRILYKCSNADSTCINLAGYVVNSGKLMKPSFGDARFGEGNRYLLAKRASARSDVIVMMYAMDGAAQTSCVDLIVAEAAPMQSGQITVMNTATVPTPRRCGGQVPDRRLPRRYRAPHGKRLGLSRAGLHQRERQRPGP